MTPEKTPGFEVYKAQSAQHTETTWKALTGEQQENWEIFARRITRKNEFYQRKARDAKQK